MVPPLCSGDGLFVGHSVIPRKAKILEQHEKALSLSIRRPTSDRVFAGEVIVFKGTSDPVLGHAIGKSGDTESDVGGGAVLVPG
jgi:hypothetical protein